MADSVLIRVEHAVEGADLVRCLNRHGLSAGLVRVGPGWHVEVNSLGEDPRPFHADLGVALATWSGAGGGGRGAARRAAA